MLMEVMTSLKPSGFLGCFHLGPSRLGELFSLCFFLLGFLGLDSSGPPSPFWSSSAESRFPCSLTSSSPNHSGKYLFLLLLLISDPVPANKSFNPRPRICVSLGFWGFLLPSVTVVRGIRQAVLAIQLGRSIWSPSGPPPADHRPPVQIDPGITDHRSSSALADDPGFADHRQKVLVDPGLVSPG